MTVEEMLQPVKTPEGWTIAEQFKKVVEENGEVGAELSKYFDLRLNEAQRGERQPIQEYLYLADAAVEVGDVIIAAAKLIDMLGFEPATIINACYKKNLARGYYSANGTGAK